MMSDEGADDFPPAGTEPEQNVNANRADGSSSVEPELESAPELPVLIEAEDTSQSSHEVSTSASQISLAHKNGNFEAAPDIHTKETKPEIVEDDPKRPTKHESRNQSQDLIIKALYCLYLAQALGCWGDRMWDFAIALFFVAIWPDSLLLVAVYGLASAASAAFMGTFVGRYVTLCARRELITNAVIAQMVTVLLTAGAIMLLLIPGGSPSLDNEATASAAFSAAWIQPGFLFYSLVITIVLLAVVGALAGLAGSVALERDWVVVIAAESSKTGQLGEINTILCRIDLISRLFAPIAVGTLMYFTTSLSAAAYITLWNLLSAFLEYHLLLLTYNSVPALSLKPTLASRHTSVGREPERGGKESELEPMTSENATTDMFSDMEMFDEDLSSPGKEGQADVDKQNADVAEGGGLLGASSGCSDRSNPGEVLPGETFEGQKGWHLPAGLDTKDFQLKWREFRDDWKVYMKQESLYAGLSVALQFLTVLSFDALMTADLRWTGVSPLLLGVGRGLSATAGLGGTLLFPFLQKEIGTLRTGMYAGWCQCSFLLLCLIGTFFEGAVFQVFLMVGVIGSRVGLYAFDLSAKQVVQESVPESERGVVGEVQGSLQQMCSMIIFAVGIALSRPNQFWILIVISFTSTTMAAVSYLLHVGFVRGDIWPVPQDYYTV